MLNEFEKAAVSTALRKMFMGDYFDICTVNKCIEITGAIPDLRDHNALSALHCVHWSEMTPELRNTVLEKTLIAITSPGFDLSIIDVIDRKSNTMFKVEEKESLAHKFFKAIQGG